MKQPTKQGIRQDFIRDMRLSLKTCRDGQAQHYVAYGLNEILYILMNLEIAWEGEPITIEEMDPTCTWTELFGYETHENHRALTVQTITSARTRGQWTPDDIEMIANRIAWGITYEESGLTPQEIQKYEIDEKVREAQKTKFRQ